jgi:putative tryptophan/tyrosine transport system substrate-binding protein
MADLWLVIQASLLWDMGQEKSRKPCSSRAHRAVEGRQGSARGRAHDLASAFAALTAWHAGAVLALSGPPIGNALAHLARLAVEHRVPAMFIRKEFVEIGGLLAYGPSWADNYRRATTYVDKILKGTKPADLPVEQPTTFELVINLKTAKAFGLTLSPTLLFRADEVIQ